MHCKKNGKGTGDFLSGGHYLLSLLTFPLTLIHYTMQCVIQNTGETLTLSYEKSRWKIPLYKPVHFALCH